MGLTYNPNIISVVANENGNSIVFDIFKSTEEESKINLTNILGLIQENLDGACNFMFINAQLGQDATPHVRALIEFIMGGHSNLVSLWQQRCYQILHATKVNAEQYFTLFYDWKTSLNDLKSLHEKHPENQMMKFGYLIKKKQYEAMTPGGSAKRSMRKNRKIRSILKRVRRSRRNQRRRA